LKQKRTSNRVAAWIYSVINPIIPALDREQEVLNRTNLTWRGGPRRFEVLRQVREYVDSSQWPNYEDFVADNPTFGKGHFKRHDDALVEMEGLALKYFESLLRHHFFKRVLAATLEKHETANPRQSLNYMKDELAEYVAECIVNDVRSLPSHYTTHEYWNQYSNEFSSLRQGPELESLRSSAVKLARVSLSLKGTLEKLRLELCRTYDVPAAPLPAQNGSTRVLSF